MVCKGSKLHYQHLVRPISEHKVQIVDGKRVNIAQHRRYFAGLPSAQHASELDLDRQHMGLLSCQMKQRDDGLLRSKAAMRPA